MIDKIFTAILKVIVAITKFVVKTPVALSAVFFTGMALHGLYTGEMFQALFGTILSVMCWRFVL